MSYRNVCADCKKSVPHEQMRKVGEEFSYHSDTFHPEFHNLTTDICLKCFTRIMGPAGMAISADFKKAKDKEEKDG